MPPTSTTKPPVESPKPEARDEAKLSQADHVGDGQKDANGKPDFTGTGYNHADVERYSHGGSASAALQPVATPSPVAGTGPTDPVRLDESED